ncbi:MAG TPA: nuclear transport factor 2 family protein [Pseudonocardia sp.]|jgi:ketosteroid isomerase-like protein|nr:nuclear transport factor 2 family protein [Pseudonocardia sp.]
MTRDVRAIFATIDRLDADGFVGALTPGVRFRFGNAEPVVGSAAVRDAVTGFFGTIAGLTHHVLEVWDTGPDVTAVRIEVEYVRTDGKHVTVPNLDVLRWQGDRVADWQIYIDLTPVFS